MAAGACRSSRADSGVKRCQQRTAVGFRRLGVMATEQQEHLKIDQLRHQSADELEHIEGRDREHLEGWIPALASDGEIREALEKAFDYRGDITITRKDGSQVVGYLFDRRQGSSLDDSFVRVIPSNAQTKLN